jgi:hypothetical protein
MLDFQNTNINQAAISQVSSFCIWIRQCAAADSDISTPVPSYQENMAIKAYKQQQDFTFVVAVKVRKGAIETFSDLGNCAVRQPFSRNVHSSRHLYDRYQA